MVTPNRSRRGATRATPRVGALKPLTDAGLRPVRPTLSDQIARATGVRSKGYLAPARARRGVSSHRSTTSLDVGLFVGGDNFSFGLGYSNGHHGSSFGLSFGFGGGYDYSWSYLHTAAYSPYWNWYAYGIGSPYHLGYGSPAEVYLGNPLYYNPFTRFARFHFGYSYYYPFTPYSPYPVYRSSFYEPYYVSYLSYDVPVFRTYSYVRCDRPVETVYVETADPYVDEEVIVDEDVVDWDGDDYAYAGAGYAGSSTGSSSYRALPTGFRDRFADDVPSGLQYDEYLAWGEDALYDGAYLTAAEAFRQAMVLRPDDDYPLFQMAHALFGAGRYRLAGRALEMGLALNPAWVHRRFDVRDGFSSEEEFARLLQNLELYLIQNDRDEVSRYVLGYMYFFSGNLFGARSVLRTISDHGATFRELGAMAREAERRLVKRR